MKAPGPRPVVHLELHTRALPEACAFYRRLCGWQAEHVLTPAGDYHAIELGCPIGGGVVECPTQRPLWLPYVEVAQIHELTEQARDLGARILLEPREGPAGWRSVVSTPAAGELALWESKRGSGR